MQHDPFERNIDRENSARIAAAELHLNKFINLEEEPYSRERHLPIILGADYVRGLAMREPRLCANRDVLSEELLLTAVIWSQLRIRRKVLRQFGGPHYSMRLVEKALRKEHEHLTAIFNCDVLAMSREQNVRGTFATLKEKLDVTD